MPIRITGGQNGPTTLEYDADHHRVAKRGPTDTTLYVNDLYDCTGPSSQTSFACTEQHFKIFAGGKQVAEVTRDQFNVDTTKYIHSDHLGSATLVTDATGGLLESRAYDAFGQPSVDLTNNVIKTGFTGHEHDADLGFINMKGRLYDPTTRRFLTPDPIVADPYNPQGLNRYSYVTNNPLNLTDPSGFNPAMGSPSPQGGGPGSEAGSGGGGYFYGTNKFTEDVVKGYTANDQSGYGAAQQRAQNSEGNGYRDLVGVGYSVPVQPGGFCGPNGDLQAPANQNRSSDPGAGTSTGSVAQSTDNRTASPAPGTTSGAATDLPSGLTAPKAYGPGIHLLDQATRQIPDTHEGWENAFKTLMMVAPTPGVVIFDGIKGAEAAAQVWKLGGFKSAAKWLSQLAKRGWTPRQITEAIEKGEQFAAENLVNKGNAAIRYVHPGTGQSVVLDEVTKEVIHVGGPGFKY